MWSINQSYQLHLINSFPFPFIMNKIFKNYNTSACWIVFSLFRNNTERDKLHLRKKARRLLLRILASTIVYAMHFWVRALYICFSNSFFLESYMVFLIFYKWSVNWNVVGLDKAPSIIGQMMDMVLGFGGTEVLFLILMIDLVVRLNGIH